MARLQILQLPEGAGDDRPPFVLVIDQAPRDESSAAFREDLTDNEIAVGIGARHVLVFEDTIEIPANAPADISEPDGKRRCGEHDGPCFPEAGAKCVAHGDEECPYCHRNPADCANGGNCSTWARTGMHWDTCANRVRGPLAFEDPERAGTTQIVYAHERTRLDLCGALLVSGDTTWRKLVEETAERQRTVARLFRQLDRVREMPERPEVMAVNPEQPYAYMDGYAAGIRAAKRAAQNERPQTAEHGG